MSMRSARYTFLVAALAACASPPAPATGDGGRATADPELQLATAASLAPATSPVSAPPADGSTMRADLPEADAGSAVGEVSPSRALAAELAPGRSPDLAPRRQTTYRGRGIPYEPGIFNFTLGSRWFEDSRWGALDNQLALGLDYTIKQRDAWIGLNFGLLGSWDQARIGATYVDAWLVEGYLGPRAYLQLPGTPFYGYAGVAVSLVYNEIERVGVTRFSDTVWGGSASAGLMFQLNRQQALGVEWRTLQFTEIDADQFGGPSDANYQQVSLVFSAAF